MHSTLLITDVDFAPASDRNQAKGFMGYVACTVDSQLRLDGLALRRAADGRYSISFPERRDARGVRHPYMRPVDAQARADIERQVIGALKRDGRIK